jgi:ATP-dependent Clp protease ATP-binding subunit ClpB
MEVNKETKKRLEEAKYALEVAQRDGNFERASQLRFQTIPELEAKLPDHESDSSSSSALEELKTGLMVHERVTSGDIARVVAKATGGFMHYSKVRSYSPGPVIRNTSSKPS